MSDNSKRDIYLEMYRQCNEYLRATDSKRDQVLAFYAIVVSLLFGFLGRAAMPETHLKHLSIGLTVFGVVLAVVLLSYRTWHTVYVNSAILLQVVALRLDATKQESFARKRDQCFGRSEPPLLGSER